MQHPRGSHSATYPQLTPREASEQGRNTSSLVPSARRTAGRSSVSEGPTAALAKHPLAMKRAATTTAAPLPYEGSRHQTLSAYIQARFDEFSRSQKDVAQYIVDHLDEVAFQTAEELARRANTSSSTVVRFSQALGFEGFPELQHAAREEYRRKVAAGPRAAGSRLARAAVLARPERVRDGARRRPPERGGDRPPGLAVRRRGRDRRDRRGRPRARLRHRPDGVLRLLPAPPAHAAGPARRDRRQPVAGGARAGWPHRRGHARHRPVAPAGRTRSWCGP